MRTKLGYTVSVLLSLLLCAVMLCTTVLPTAAEVASLPSLDYSNPAIDSRKSLSIPELYNILLNRVPTEGETLYWQAKGFSLQYNDNIPNDRIDTNYDNEILDVTASPYTYTAANGATVTWIPESIKLETVSGEWEQHSLTEQNGVYTAQISCKYSGDFDMKVVYVCEIAIAGSIVEALHNEAYREGANALALMTAYEKEKAKYDKYVADKYAYDNYVDNKAAYEQYLKDKAAYDVLYEAYRAYLAEDAAYWELVELEKQWAEYWAQQEKYNATKDAYAKYFAYSTAYQKAVDTLAMFEGIFAKEDRGWCMYNDIMGSAVTEVLGRQDELVAGGCNADDIQLAGVATEHLRVLLGGYNELRTAKYASDHDKYKALYEYYQANYDALTKNFCDLYKTLKGLYGNSAVSGYIALKEKTEHYRQLVGHLFVVSTALDRTSERDENGWRIDRKPLLEVIRENVHYFPDSNTRWYPSATYPAEEVAYVEEVKEPQKPAKDEPMFVPAEPPTPVQNPGEGPAKVEDPGEPKDAPTPVDEPQSPEKDFTNATKTLYQEVRDGKLFLYNGSVPEAVPLRLTVEANHSISIQNVKTVIFYDLEGNPYRTEQRNYGETVKCAPLEHDTTVAAYYRFLCWKDADGNEIGKTAEIEVTKNISLYPHYLATPRMYTVTFIVESEWGEPQTKSVTYNYGTPLDAKQFVNIPLADAAYQYSFSGWQTVDGEPVDVTMVTGDATYKGYLQRTLRKYTVTWVINERNETFTEQVEYGNMPSFNGDLSVSPSSCIYRFMKWDKTLSTVKGDITYTAIYREIPLATDTGDVALEVLHSDTEIKVMATDGVVTVKEAALLAAQTNKTLTVCWDGVLSVSLSGEDLQTYIDIDTPKLILTVSQEGDTEIYEFKYNLHNSTVSVLPDANVQFAYSKTNNQVTLFEMQTEDGWQRLEKDQATVQGSFKARRIYSYSIFCVPNEFCNVKQPQMAKQAIEGEWVSIDLNCNYGYKVVGATIEINDGQTITVTGVSFQMPASVATLTLQVEKIVYRVTFMVDGQVWNTAEYHMGDAIVLPEDPTKQAEDGYVYAFSGWGEVPALATGEDEELVFEASFDKVQLVSDYETGHNNNVLVTVVLPCVGAAVALLVAFLILNRVVRKKGGWKVVRIQMTCRIRVFFKKIKDALTKKKSLKSDAAPIKKETPKSNSAPIKKEAPKSNSTPIKKGAPNDKPVQKTNTQQAPKAKK